MKFSFRVGAVIVFCSVAVLLYMSQWFTKNGILSFIWTSSHESLAHAEDLRREFNVHMGPKFSALGRRFPYFKPKSLEQCVRGESKPDLVATADIRSWEILEKLAPEDTARVMGNAAWVNNEGLPEPPNPVAEGAKTKRPLKVIVVPHSHNDPGWHKTVEGYFEDQTKPTLDFMVEKMMKFPKMTFIWAESVFLSLWWRDIDERKRADVKRLIAEGRLEIVVGSWVVPDEANPHYFALIDQMIEGHQWLWEHMGVRPNNTWALDPFGYSSGLPYLYKLAGYENMVILRVHEHLKKELIRRKGLEFMWRQSWDEQGRHDIRTQMMPYKLYNIKHTCGPDQEVCLLFDFRKIPNEVSESRAEPVGLHNVDRLAKILLGQYHKKAKLFRHNVLLVPLGDDFRYDRSIEWDQQYKNYMMLFNHMNSKENWNVHARFGTLQDYFNELDVEMKLDSKLKLPTLEGDFFPYTDENNDFWTGYFTSRPYDKNLGREVESHIRTAEIFNAVAAATADSKGRKFALLDKNMRFLRKSHQSLGLFQHHDAITGTARSYVVVDYENRLKAALTETGAVILNAARFLLESPPPPPPPEDKTQAAAAASAAPLHLDIDDPPSLRPVKPLAKRKVLRPSPTGSDVVVANSLPYHRTELVQLLVTTDTVEVIGPDGELLASQISPVWELMELSGTHFELSFYAHLPPVSLTRVKVRATRRDQGRRNSAAVVRLFNTQDYRVPKDIRFQVLPPGGGSIVLENEEFRLRFSPRTGLMHSITTKRTIQTTKINMQYLTYKSRGSGAYIFYPAGPAIDNELSNRPAIRVVRGPLFSEIHVVHSIVQSRVRVHNVTTSLAAGIAISNVVDIRELDNMEFIMRLSSDIQSDGVFYTDVNGLEMARRKRNRRFPIQANYYPMASTAFVEDQRTRLTLVSGQPLGVTSGEDGQLEVMLDRRLSYDDGRGLGEGVLDNKITPSNFMLIVEHPTSPPTQGKPAATATAGAAIPKASLTSLRLANRLNYPVLTMFATNGTTVATPKLTAFSDPFPCDVRLVGMRTLPPVRETDRLGVALVLHRTAHDCAYPHTDGECPAQKPLRLRHIFQDAPVASAKETTLSLMHDKRVQDTEEDLGLGPLELATYVVKFR